MPILKNAARQITLSVRLSGTTDGPYVASTWPNDATAKMYYSKDGGTPVAIVPTRIDASTGGWLLSVATLTASVWNCDELRVFWEGTGILSGTQTYYPEADYTSTVAGRIDAAVSSRSTLTAADVWANGTRTLTSFGTLVADTATAVWAAATRTLTAISDSSGITTLLDRLTNTRATNLDNLTVAPLDAAGTRAAMGLAAANLDTQLSGINSKTTNLPASPAAVGSAMTLATDAVNSSSLAASAVTEIAAGISASSSVYAVQGIRTRIAGVEEDYITLVKSDDKSVVIIFEDDNHNPAVIPATATAALLDSGGASVGTATVTTITAAAGYMLLRLQAPSSGNLPTTLRITFTGGSGAAYKHDIPVRSWA